MAALGSVTGQTSALRMFDGDVPLWDSRKKPTYAAKRYWAEMPLKIKYNLSTERSLSGSYERTARLGRVLGDDEIDERSGNGRLIEHARRAWKSMAGRYRAADGNSERNLRKTHHERNT